MTRPLLRQAPARLRATLVAAVVLFCQAAAWIHGAATPHVTCAEHGERVHVAAKVPDPGQPGPRGLATIRGDADGHEHDHCGLQVQGATRAPAPARQAMALAQGAPAARPEASHALPVGLLRLAPKTSPPRAPA